MLRVEHFVDPGLAHSRHEIVGRVVRYLLYFLCDGIQTGISRACVLRREIGIVADPIPHAGFSRHAWRFRDLPQALARSETREDFGIVRGIAGFWRAAEICHLRRFYRSSIWGQKIDSRISASLPEGAREAPARTGRVRRRSAGLPSAGSAEKERQAEETRCEKGSEAGEGASRWKLTVFVLTYIIQKYRFAFNLALYDGANLLLRCRE